MFRIKVELLLLLVVLIQTRFRLVKSNKFDYKWECGNSNSRHLVVADDATRTTNDTAKKNYIVEYSDHEDIPNYRKLLTPHTQQYNFFEGNYFFTNERNNKLFINKCCSLNSYFDIENYNCVEFDNDNYTKNLTEFFFNGLNNQDGTKYLFVENEPRCDNNSVVSTYLLTKIEFEGLGIKINETIYKNYCIDKNPNYLNQTIVLICQYSNEICFNKKCFRKCCPLKQSYGPMGRKCQRTNHPFHPEFFRLPSLDSDNSITLSDYGLLLGDACEKQGKYLLERDEGEISYLDVSGNLYVPMYKKCFKKNDFCLEHVEFGNYSEIGSFLCFAKGSSNFENSNLQYLLLSSGLIISCTFLLFTFLFYLFSPKSRNLYGKTIMCYICSLFTAYLCLAIVGLKSTELNKRLCIYMGKC